MLAEVDGTLFGQVERIVGIALECEADVGEGAVHIVRPELSLLAVVVEARQDFATREGIVAVVELYGFSKLAAAHAHIDGVHDVRSRVGRVDTRGARDGAIHEDKHAGGVGSLELLLGLGGHVKRRGRGAGALVDECVISGRLGVVAAEEGDVGLELSVEGAVVCGDSPGDPVGGAVHCPAGSREGGVGGRDAIDELRVVVVALGDIVSEQLLRRR